jgi:hypothetical protein
MGIGHQREAQRSDRVARLDIPHWTPCTRDAIAHTCDICTKAYSISIYMHILKTVSSSIVCKRYRKGSVSCVR